MAVAKPQPLLFLVSLLAKSIFETKMQNRT